MTVSVPLQQPCNKYFLQLRCGFFVFTVVKLYKGHSYAYIYVLSASRQAHPSPRRSFNLKSLTA